jgi:hypothetical protein
MPLAKLYRVKARSNRAIAADSLLIIQLFSLVFPILSYQENSQPEIEKHQGDYNGE